MCLPNQSRAKVKSKNRMTKKYCEPKERLISRVQGIPQRYCRFFPDHNNKDNIAIKWITQKFWLPSAYKSYAWGVIWWSSGWLELGAFIAMALVLIPGQGTKILLSWQKKKVMFTLYCSGLSVQRYYTLKSNLHTLRLKYVFCLSEEIMYKYN